jgi:phage baseplate assembly protein W
MGGGDTGTSAFLGVGWAFPVAAADAAHVAQAAYEQRVHDAIWIILSTSPGERKMRPDFGCGLDELVFATPDATTAGRVADAVRHALVRWEPRIDLLGVDAWAQPDDVSTLLVQIDYRVRATNNVFNLVYPFYLEGR